MGVECGQFRATLCDTRIIFELIVAVQKINEFLFPPVFLGLTAIALSGAALGQVSPIDAASSKLLVHVSKSGVFSGFADNHEVEAPISAGTIDEKGGRLRFSIDSRRMTLLDPQLPPDKRQQVQERMLGPDVLDSTRFPEIPFESTHVERDSEARIRVEGRLSLHGVTKSVSLVAGLRNGRYTGRVVLKQRDFGITPVSIAGGTVKVKNELTIDFDIRPSDRETTKQR
jgi:polyisoprenoid-binding protein YceI